MTSRSRHFFRISALLASALFATGCATQSVLIRPDQLPDVAAWADQKPLPKQPGSFIDAYGRKVELRGELEEVVVERRDMPGIKELYEAPVKATIQGNLMFVEGNEYRQVYLPRQISSVEVNVYDKYKARRVGGGVALGLGGGFLLGGLGAFAGFASMGGLAGPLFAFLVGIPMGVVGLGGVTTGTVLLATGSPPKAGDKQSAMRAPQLRVGLGSGGLQFSF